MTLVSIITFSLVLSLIVFVHELGHFLAAMWAGVKVEEFGLGFPPRAVRLFKRWGVEFSLNWVPFGGFVKMEGEEPPDDAGWPSRPRQSDKRLTQLSGRRQPFYALSAGKRTGVIVAGVAANFIFGLVAFTVVFSRVGIPTQLAEPRVGQVAEDSPAAQAGLPADVTITAIQVLGPDSAPDQSAGQPSDQSADQLPDLPAIPVKTPDDVIAVVNTHRGRRLRLSTTGECNNHVACSSQAQQFDIYARTAEETPQGEGSLGIGFTNSALKFFPWYEMPVRSAWVGFQQTTILILLTLQGLGRVFLQLFGGVVPQDVAGPIGIVHQAQQSGIFEEGALALLNFAGIISVSIGVMNLLPIPIVDGGRAVFVGLEQVLGRSRASRIEGYANYGGMALIVALIVAVTVLDISRIISPS
ncbi:MAG: hypothetical protein COU69_00340 [Candidatus Pacebacteria bacterium CG10_big_fil_rev_8_21_14_0_10_56_10]|nr:MAG: hypothetical protein COU69_00340 [Candidatus Pacebacteria bacterium CG10_big_fil_rev_8_21_14_0_10_56_10]